MGLGLGMSNLKLDYHTGTWSFQKNVKAARAGGGGLVPKSLLFLQQGAWECGADVPILSLYWP